MEQLLLNQLNKKTKTNFRKMSYYEEIPLKQIHIDTFFYTNKLMKFDKPILMIVDVATHYVGIYVQERKNENIIKHVRDFIQTVKEKFNTNLKEKEMTIITDGAKEFNVLDKNFNHKISISIHKAALAEAYIGRTKVIIRDLYLKNYLKDILTAKKGVKIKESNHFLEYLNIAKETINKKAKIKKRKIEKLTENHQSEYKIGDAVFIKTDEKFFEQLRKMKKKSYLDNFITEPFYISDVIFYDGVYKYAVSSFFDHSVDKYYHYGEQLQSIDPDLVDIYINQYKTYYKSKDTPETTFIPKNVKK